MHQWMALILVYFGTIFIVIAAIGILKMPDLFMRMHAATKAGTLGNGLMLLGVVFYFLRLQAGIEAMLTLMFIYITAPIASHLIARAAYRQKIKLDPSTKINELDKYYRAMKSKLTKSKRKPR